MYVKSLCMYVCMMYQAARSVHVDALGMHCTVNHQRLQRYRCQCMYVCMYVSVCMY